MTFKLREDLVEGIYRELSLVSGSSVQTYNEPMVQAGIQAAFDHLFKKRFWDHLTLTTFHTLDGVGGVVTDEIVNLEDLTDIKWVRESPYEEKDVIHYFEDGLFNTNDKGYTAIPYDETGYSTKRIKFNPIDSALDIAVRARRKPANFEDGHTVPFDYLMMQHFVAARLLASDGMNPGAEAEQRSLFEDRYDTLVSNEANKPLIARRNRFASDFTVA